jgi:hypothetical protein
MPAKVSAAVEGTIDEIVAKKLIAHAGGIPGTVYGKGGKPALHAKIAGYNNAAHRAPWLVLVDLDQDYDCAPPLRAAWLPACAPRLCFRVAVRAVEAWLLADVEEVAAYLQVARSAVPPRPEIVDEPKRALVDLARRSRRREIREGMVPREGSGRVVGSLYNSYVSRYVEQRWRPAVAAKRAESLARAIACLEQKIREAGKAANIG